MKTPTIIVFDLDGTLFDENGRIHPNDAMILRSCQDVRFIAATGRFLEAARLSFARNGLFKDGPLPLPLVMQNGAALYLPGEKLVSFFSFTPETQNRLIALGQSTPNTTCMLSDAGKLFALSLTEFGIQEARRFDLPFQPFDTKNSGKFGKLMCISDDPACLSRIADQAQDLPVELAYSMSTILEITPQGTSKGRGLTALLSQMDLEGCPVYAIGDGGNDISLFDMASTSFTPSTSPPEIQARVDQIILREPDGILIPVLRAAGYPVENLSLH